MKFLPLLSPIKVTREKGRFLKAKQMKLLSVLLLTKAVKGENNSETQDSPDPFELMINYFDKRFEGIEKKLQHPSNKNPKIEDTFKFKDKGNRIQFEFSRKIL